MASLDNLEGGLVEGAGLVLLVILGLIAWGFYKGIRNPLAALKAGWAALLNAFQSASNAEYAGPGDAQVYTGSGLSDGAVSFADYLGMQTMGDVQEGDTWVKQGGVWVKQ